jgi:hypothetical protein
VPEEYDPTRSRQIPVQGDDDVVTVDTRRQRPAAGGAAGGAGRPPRGSRSGAAVPRQRKRHPVRNVLIAVLVLLLVWAGALFWLPTPPGATW